MNKNYFEDLGHKVKDLVVNVENEFTEDLQALITDYTVDVNINYNFKLLENTLDDEMQFRISLREGSRTKIKITFNCMSPTLTFKRTIKEGIAEIINNNAKYEDLIELTEYSNLALLHDFNIKDRR